MSDLVYLAHHGIKGQKWGVRNYQNTDGSLTPEGRLRYGVGELKSKISGTVTKAKKLSKFGVSLGKAKSEQYGKEFGKELSRLKETARKSSKQSSYVARMTMNKVKRYLDPKGAQSAKLSSYLKSAKWSYAKGLALSNLQEMAEYKSRKAAGKKYIEQLESLTDSARWFSRARADRRDKFSSARLGKQPSRRGQSFKFFNAEQRATGDTWREYASLSDYRQAAEKYWKKARGR